MGPGSEDTRDAIPDSRGSDEPESGIRVSVINAPIFDIIDAD